MSRAVSVKGTREGLTIALSDADMSTLLEAIEEHLWAHGAFFRGGRVALEVGDRAMAEEDLTAIAGLLERYQMVLRTIMTANGVTQRACKELGLRLLAPDHAQVSKEVRRPKAEPDEKEPGGDKNLADKAVALFIRNQVRSGQVLRHTGNITVLGDVNPGAEIVAGGDVVVWGRLRGLVHAGYMSNPAAVVCALDFAPMQLRIANLATRSDASGGAPMGPEVAFVSDNEIVVRPWSDLRTRGR